MAQEAKKKDLVALPVQRQGKSLRGIQVREIKMVAPACTPCQEKNLPRWWEKCKHNPYFSQAPRAISVPVLACAVCGDEVEQDTAMHCDQTKFELRGSKESVQYEMVANTRRVPVDEAVRTGRQVERQQAKGWVFPQELGIAPMCEFQGCWEPNPTVKTEWGNYCTKNEARIIRLNQLPEAVEVHNERKIQQQLQSVSLD